MMIEPTQSLNVTANQNEKVIYRLLEILLCHVVEIIRWVALRHLRRGSAAFPRRRTCRSRPAIRHTPGGVGSDYGSHAGILSFKWAW